MSVFLCRHVVMCILMRLWRFEVHKPFHSPTLCRAAQFIPPQSCDVDLNKSWAWIRLKLFLNESKLWNFVPLIHSDLYFYLGAWSGYSIYTSYRLIPTDAYLNIAYSFICENIFSKPWWQQHGTYSASRLACFYRWLWPRLKCWSSLFTQLHGATAEQA